MFQWKRNLYVSWLTQILSMTGFGFMMPFIPLYIQQLGVTAEGDLRFWVGMISAVPNLAMGIMAPLWGILSDRLGRKLMILRAMLFGTIIVGCMALARNVATVFILRIAQGLFTGTITAAATLVAAGTPRHKMSSALGLLSSSTFIGFSLGPFVGGVAAEVFGFRVSFLIGGFVILCGFFLALIFIKEPKSSEGSSRPHKVKTSLRLLFSAPFGILFVIIFMERFSRMLPQPFMALYVQQLLATPRGVSAITGTISAAAGLATAIAGLTLTRLGDKYDKGLLLAIFFAAAAVTALPIVLKENLIWFTGFYLVSIYFIGAVNPLLQSQLSTLTHPNNRGAVLGLQTSVGGVGWFFSPLAGSAVAIYLDLKYVFLFYALSLLLSLLIPLYLQSKKTKNTNYVEGG
ncbi:MAG: MFS transporter [Spirochaetaceae bacterium]|nr:MAG: MFS transporter [Spirochaetaceae bacterium]